MFSRDGLTERPDPDPNFVLFRRLPPTGLYFHWSSIKRVFRSVDNKPDCVCMCVCMKECMYACMCIYTYVGRYTYAQTQVSRQTNRHPSHSINCHKFCSGQLRLC